jgi:hypothetical protein
MGDGGEVPNRAGEVAKCEGSDGGFGLGAIRGRWSRKIFPWQKMSRRRKVYTYKFHIPFYAKQPFVCKCRRESKTESYYHRKKENSARSRGDVN